MATRPVYFDCDTGIDDALALAYLATFNDAELLGAIGTYGNVATDTAVRNTAYVLELLELHDVPVMRGSQDGALCASAVPDSQSAQQMQSHRHQWLNWRLIMLRTADRVRVLR